MVQSKNNEYFFDLWPDVGSILHRSRAAIYADAREGRIETVRIGKRILVSRMQLEKLAGQTQEKA